MYLTSFFSSDDDFRNDHQNLTGDDYRVSGWRVSDLVGWTRSG